MATTLDQYLGSLETLLGMVSDTISSGRLREADIPDDFEAIVSQVAECNAVREKMELESTPDPAPHRAGM